MGRKVFVNDLRDAALPGRLDQITSVSSGDEDGTIKFVFQSPTHSVGEIAVDALVSGMLLSHNQLNSGLMPLKYENYCCFNILLLILIQTFLIIPRTTHISFSLHQKMFPAPLQRLSREYSRLLLAIAYARCC